MGEPLLGHSCAVPPDFLFSQKAPAALDRSGRTRYNEGRAQNGRKEASKLALLRKFFAVENMLPSGMQGSGLPSSSEMYRKYIQLALPSVLEMVLISLINMMDTVMVSTVGTDAVAAVGLVGQPRMLMLCFFFAINTGITAVVARRKGEQRREDANTVLRNSMVLILLLSLVLMALFLPFSKPLMRFAGAEEGRTLEDATAYYIIVGLALPFNALSMGICAAQRGIGNTKLTMYVNIASNLVNILFNWLLINGIGPFPKLGVVGAAIATAIGLFCGFVLSLISVLNGKKHDAFLQLSVRDDWKLQKQAVSDVSHVALSSMVEQLVLRVGFFSYAKIVANLGTDAFAAHQIVMQFLNLSFSFADGLGIAGTALVGQMLGAKRKDMAHVFGSLAQRFAFLVSLLLASLCIFARGPLVSMFISENANPGVREMAEAVMIVLGVIQPFQMLSVVASGALRGAGDVKYTARVMTLTVMLIRPLLALLAVWLCQTVWARSDWALIGAWLASMSDMTTRAILFMRRYQSGKWHDLRV